jgi:hypothetical protein
MLRRNPRPGRILDCSGAAAAVLIIRPADLDEKSSRSLVRGSIEAQRQNGLLLIRRWSGAPVIRAVAGLGIPIELSGDGPRSRHSPPGSGGVKPTAVVSAVRAHRGTEGSNPFPSSGESSANLTFGPHPIDEPSGTSNLLDFNP